MARLLWPGGFLGQTFKRGAQRLRHRADLCGIAMAGGTIVDAKVTTTSDGLALDIFSVQDADGSAFEGPT